MAVNLLPKSMKSQCHKDYIEFFYECIEGCDDKIVLIATNHLDRPYSSPLDCIHKANNRMADAITLALTNFREFQFHCR